MDPKKGQRKVMRDEQMPSKFQSPADIKNLSILSVAIGIIAVTGFIILSFQDYIKLFSSPKHYETKENTNGNILKKYWVFAKNTENGYLDHVFTILDHLGYENDANTTEWDLLWAHDYPFRTLHSELNNLKPHQKVNKLPGSGFITNKVDLATSGLKYIPVAFRLPEQKQNFLEYVQLNADEQFVEKNNEHRNIHIRKVEDIDLNSTGKFIQKYVGDPLLISGYKFDIGIYTIITSVDPLRVYIYNGDVLLRFCPEKYEPFDAKNIDKYVVGDDYLPIWEVPDLKYYYNNLGFGMKESLNAYIRSQGKDPSMIWEQIEDSIRTVALAKEPLIINAMNKFPSKRNFFEMMRFDFVLTSNLKVFLMEANMSPNLSSSHFPPNRLLFEQVIYNLFGLVGIAVREKKNTLATQSAFEEQMQVADKNIMVYPSECGSALCMGSCVSLPCQLCKPCLSSKAKENLVQAVREHINRGSCKRIFPPPMIQPSDMHDNFDDYSAKNQLHCRWFLGKCLMDISWCN